MSRASILAQGRRAAEAGMVDTCRITRVTSSTTDRETGERTVGRTTIYEGPYRMQELTAFSREADPAPDQSVLARYRVLQLPVATSTGIQIGDDVELLTSTNDPDMVGQALKVRDQSAKSEATSRRVGVEQVTG